jgi:hypothetical protein
LERGRKELERKGMEVVGRKEDGERKVGEEEK